MPPGGQRTGQPQTAYPPARSDLNAGTQPVKSAKAETYGDRGRREDAQNVIPLPQARAAIPPGSMTPMTAATERPGEPVTTGLPVGPGAGPEALMVPGGANDSLWELRALVARFPQYTDLARIVAAAENEL